MKKIFLLAMAALVLTACEKEIEVDIEGTTPMVVVQSQNEVGRPVSLHLTYSRPIFSTFYIPTGAPYFEEIDNATVSLAVNGTNLGDANRDGGVYSFSYVPEEGDRLDLKVSVPGEEPITASATVPNRPTVKDVEAKYVESSDNEYDYYYSFDLRFTLVDKAATADFYSIRIYEDDTIYYVVYDSLGNIERYDTVVPGYYNNEGREIVFECSDYQIVDANMGIDDIFEMEPGEEVSFYGTTLFFTDGNINGTEHQIKLRSYLNYRPEYYRHDSYNNSDRLVKVCVRLEVTAYSRDMYLYERTTDSYNGDDLLDLFGEPMQIHSNINGGIGMFGVSAKRIVELELDNE